MKDSTLTTAPVLLPKSPLRKLQRFTELVAGITLVLNQIPDTWADKLITWHLDKGDVGLRTIDFNGDDRTLLIAITADPDWLISLTDVQRWALDGLATRSGIETVDFIEQLCTAFDEDAEEELDNDCEDAGEEGVLAYRRGETLNDNPYDVEEDDDGQDSNSHLWDAGWLEAESAARYEFAFGKTCPNLEE